MAETFPQAFGRYQLRERLALGGMAELFLAQVAGAHGFEKTVVIKRILPHLAADTQFTSMFISEAKITAQLAHPKIAQTFELGTENQQLFIVMEYIDGVDVLALLRECAHRRVRVPAEVSVYILKEVLDALDFAHKLKSESGEHYGIVHRDVSPSNILLSTRGDVKLVDFGIAHAATQDGQTKSGTLKGKYGYMSPEQVLGQTVSAKSDIFAAGVVLAEMLMGRRLFAAANELDVLLMVRDVDLQRLDKFGGHIEDHLSSLLRWALRKDPGDRYQDAATFRDSLDEWLFEQRHRINATNLAEIVKSLYDDASARRKESLSRAEPTAPPHAATAAPLPSSASGVLGTGTPGPGLREGVPTGLTHHPVSDEPSAVIEVSIEEEAMLSIEETPSGVQRGPRLTPPVPSPPPAPRSPSAASSPSTPKASTELHPAKAAASSPSDEIIDFTLGPDEPELPGPEAEGLDDLDISFDTASAEIEVQPPRTAAPAVAKEVAKEVAKKDRGDYAFGDSAPGDKSMRRDSGSKSTSYDTISAAVASLSPVAPDPASRDFDDSDISAGRAAKRRLPSVDDLSKSAPPSPPTLADSGEQAARSGEIGAVSALAVLYGCTAARESGQIVLSTGGVRKEIFLKRGVPEYVSSNVASELFGATLVRMEVISSGELDMALAVMPHFGGKLGDTLVGLGLMKPLEVFRHLTKQVRSKLIEVCTWTKGHYEWFPNQKCPKQAFPLDLDPLEVYGAGAMAMSRTALDAWSSHLPSMRPIAARSSVAVPELFQVEGIRRFQESLDGSRTVSEIVGDANDSPADLHRLRLLFLLVGTNLVVDQSKAP